MSNTGVAEILNDNLKMTPAMVIPPSSRIPDALLKEGACVICHVVFEDKSELWQTGIVEDPNYTGDGNWVYVSFLNPRGNSNGLPFQKDFREIWPAPFHVV